MKHTRQITVARAETKQDIAGSLFFQIWLTVFTWIITAGTAEK